MTKKALDERLDRLTTVIEEATRSTKEGVKYFVEPAPGVLQRALSKRHHIIFGRRGSGKSSLLRKVQSDASTERRPVVYMDMEQFKAHSYPDVLVSVLIHSLDDLAAWLGSTAVNPATKRSFWAKLMSAVPAKRALNKGAAEALRGKLRAVKIELEMLLHEADAAKLLYTSGEQGPGLSRLNWVRFGRVEQHGSARLGASSTHYKRKHNQGCAVSIYF